MATSLFGCKDNCSHGKAKAAEHLTSSGQKRSKRQEPGTSVLTPLAITIVPSTAPSQSIKETLSPSLPSRSPFLLFLAPHVARGNTNRFILPKTSTDQYPCYPSSASLLECLSFRLSLLGWRCPKRLLKHP